MTINPIDPQNSTCTPITNPFSIDILIRHIAAKNTKDALQYIKQIPENELAAFIGRYPIDNSNSEAFLTALLGDKQPHVLHLLLERICKEKPTWWTENLQFQRNLLLQAIEHREKAIAEFLATESHAAWEPKRNYEENQDHKTLVKGIEEANFDALIQTLLIPIIIKQDDNKTYDYFDTILSAGSKPFFEKILQTCLHNDTFLRRQEARVLIAFLFMNERFDLGAQYFHVIEALTPKPQWLLEYDGPDDGEGSFTTTYSTWNTALFATICECMETHRDFFAEGKKIIDALHKVINPFDCGDKGARQENRISFCALRYAIRNKWQEYIQEFSQRKDIPPLEDPFPILFPHQEGIVLSSIYGELEEHYGEEFAQKFYAQLDLNNSSMLYFLLDLLLDEEYSDEAIQLCERIETAKPVWWNDEIKAGCFSILLDEKSTDCAKWFISRIPNNYDDLILKPWKERLTCTAEVLEIDEDLVDLGNAISWNSHDILEQLCNKKIAYFVEQLSKESDEQNRKKIRIALFEVIDLTLAKHDENEGYDIIHETIKKAPFEWAQSYNNLWQALHDGDDTTALAIFVQEAHKDTLPEWLQNEERVARICDCAIKNNMTHLLVAALPFLHKEIDRIVTQCVREKKIACLEQLASSGIDFFAKGRKFYVDRTNKYVDSIIEYIESNLTQENVITILSKIPLQETKICNQIKSLLSRKKNGEAQELLRLAIRHITSNPTKGATLATTLLHTLVQESGPNSAVYALVRLGASLSSLDAEQKSTLQKIEEVYGTFFTLRVLHDVPLLSIPATLALFEDASKRNKKEQITHLALRVISNRDLAYNIHALQSVLKWLLIHDFKEEAAAFCEAIFSLNSPCTEQAPSQKEPSLISLLHSKMPQELHNYINTCSLDNDRTALLKLLIQEQCHDLASLLFNRLYSLTTKPAWLTKEVGTELFFCVASLTKNENMQEIAITLLHDPLFEIRTTTKGNPLLTALREGFPQSEITKLLKTRFAISLSEQQFHALMQAAKAAETPFSISVSLDVLGGTNTSNQRINTMSLMDRYTTIQDIFQLGLLDTRHERSLIATLFAIDPTHVARSGLPTFVAPPKKGFALDVLGKIVDRYAPTLETSIHQFINKIETRIADVSAPSIEGIRDSFYITIENQLLHVIDYFLGEIQNIELSEKKHFYEVITSNKNAEILHKQLMKFLSECAEVSGYCSTRIQDHVRFWYVQCILKQKYDFETRTHYELSSLRTTIAQGAIPIDPQNVHIYSGFLYKYGLQDGIPGAESVLEDKFIHGHEAQIESIQQHFVTQYTPLNIIECIANTIKDNRELFIDYITGLQSTKNALALQEYWLQLIHKELSQIWNDTTTNNEQKKAKSFELLENAPWYFELTEADGESLEKLETALRTPSNRKRLLLSKCERITSSGKECTLEGLLLVLLGTKLSTT